MNKSIYLCMTLLLFISTPLSAQIKEVSIAVDGMT